MINYLLNQPWYIYVGLAVFAIYHIIKRFVPTAEEVDVPKNGLVKPIRNFKAEASQTVEETKKEEEIIEAFDDSEDKLVINNHLIDDVYNDTKSELFNLHKKRRTATIFRTIMWIFTAICLMGFFVKFFIFNTTSTSNIMGYNYYEMIAIVGFVVVISVASKIFISAFVKFIKIEDDIITKMVNRLFQGYAFDRKYKISLDFLKSSCLFAGLNAKISPSTYGYLSGRHKGVHMNIVDVGIVDHNSLSSTNDVLMKIPLLNLFVVMYNNLFSSQTSSSTLFTFRGMFCWAKFNKELKGQTLIMPNRLSYSLKKIVQTTFTNAESILVEDARFAEEFTVYGSDQIEARYILTASLMEKMTEFKQKYDRPIMISFVDKKIHIAVENPNGIFAFSPGELNSSEIVKELVAEIAMALSVVEEFRLNKRTAYTENA
jgi:hypothetical protein